MKLYVVATPIGNLNDISFRAIETLKNVDCILCEDTRQTKKLLDHYQIEKPLVSYHHHSKIKKNNYILGLLKQGKNLAMVSDAGTPGLSDPGNKLIRLILDDLGEASIVPIPGSSAITAILSVAGWSTDRFVFWGFLPAKKGRTIFFKGIKQSEYPIVFFESPYRILKTLKQIDDFLNPLTCQVVAGRELTKMFETIYRGDLKQVISKIETETARGEYVVVLFFKKSKN